MMPPGIPVATVAINGGANAALIAAQIIAVSDSDLAKKLETIGIAVDEDHTIQVGAAIGSHIGPDACGLVYVAAK